MKRLLFVIVCVLSSMVVSAQTISAKEKAVARQQFINFCKDMNQQLPAQVDEITTLNSVAFINWTMTSTYTVDMDASDVSAEDMALFKSCMHDGLKEMAQKMLASGSYQLTRSKFRAFMKVVGLKFRATYKDIYSNFMFSVLLDYTDF